MKLLFLVLFLLLIICLYFLLNLSENFSSIGSEKQVSLYEDLRSYVNNNPQLHSSKNPDRRVLPYTISTNCFSSKYSECNRKDLNRVHDNICEQKAISSCVVPNRPIFVH